MGAMNGVIRPPGRLGINHGHPSAHALHSLWLPDTSDHGLSARMVDLVANRNTINVGSVQPYLEGTQTGIGLRTPFGAGCYALNPRWAPQSAGGFAPLTIMWVGRLRGLSASATIYGISGVGGGNPKLAFIQGNTGQAGVEIWLSNYNVTNPSKGFYADELAVAVITTRSPTDHEVVLWTQRAGASNAEPISCNTSSGNAGSAAANSLYEVFGAGDTGNAMLYDSDATHELCASWLRSMTRAEMVALAQDFWSVVQQEPTRSYVFLAVNSPPVVVDGSASVVEGQTLAGDVSTLATDADDDALTFAEVGGPLSGLTLNADGTFTYAAPLGTVGDVMFQFEADDGTDVSNAGTFTITVTERTGGGLLDLRLASPLTDLGSGQPPLSGGFGLKIL